MRSPRVNWPQLAAHWGAEGGRGLALLQPLFLAGPEHGEGGEAGSPPACRFPSGVSLATSRGAGNCFLFALFREGKPRVGNSIRIAHLFSLSPPTTVGLHHQTQLMGNLATDASLSRAAPPALPGLPASPGIEVQDCSGARLDSTPSRSRTPGAPQAAAPFILPPAPECRMSCALPRLGSPSWHLSGNLTSSQHVEMRLYNFMAHQFHNNNLEAQAGTQQQALHHREGPWLALHLSSLLMWVLLDAGHPFRGWSLP